MNCGPPCKNAAKPAPGAAADLMVRLATGMIRAYQLVLRPILPPACRFVPSCSEYALEALQRHGWAQGSWLAARRILRCHPFHPGGFDPVP